MKLLLIEDDTDLRSYLMPVVLFSLVDSVVALPAGPGRRHHRL